MSAFAEAQKLYREYTSYTRPLSFDQWSALPHERQAAVLFVQFYQEITLAWYKTMSFYTLEEDGVSTICQYLEKNVPIILEHPERFSSKYIYRVAYNCLYCICHDIKGDRERWENETSNIVVSGTDELDLFDTVSTVTPSAEDQLFDQSAKDTIWSIIESMGPEAKKVVNHLINGDSLGCVRKNSPSYESDPLRDVRVSSERMAEIVEELKNRLDMFK